MNGPNVSFKTSIKPTEHKNMFKNSANQWQFILYNAETCRNHIYIYTYPYIISSSVVLRRWHLGNSQNLCWLYAQLNHYMTIFVLKKNLTCVPCSVAKSDFCWVKPCDRSINKSSRVHPRNSASDVSHHSTQQSQGPAPHPKRGKRHVDGPHHYNMMLEQDSTVDSKPIFHSSPQPCPVFHSFP